MLEVASSIKMEKPLCLVHARQPSILATLNCVHLYHVLHAINQGFRPRNSWADSLPKTVSRLASNFSG